MPTPTTPREIKFRFWQIDWLDKGPGHQGRMIPWEESNTWSMEYLSRPSEFIPMQFTGLKDAKGQDIYENDIVKWIQPCDWGPDYEQIAPVTWDAKDTGFNPLCGFYVVDNGNLNDNQIPNSTLTFEVIGNIYENPDLLTPSNA